METARFFNLLRKQKYTLIAVPFLVMAIAFLLVRKLPDVYAAKGSIAAGILDGSQEGIGTSIEKNLMQETKVNQEFSNIIQMMQMKKVYDLVSYKLILHDLTSDVPFRKPSGLLKTVVGDARNHAIEVYTDKYNKREPLSLWDDDQKGLQKLLASMGYDFESLQKKLRVYRLENSDFINVEYESDSPKLSAFVVNTLCSEFIDYYSNVSKENEKRTINFLATMMAQKKDSLDNQVDSLRKFKIDNKVLNLNAQASGLYTQMGEFETKIGVMQKDIEATEGALKSLNERFNANNRGYNSNVSPLTQDILMTKQQLTAANDALIKSNYDPKFQSRIDSLKEVLSNEINQQSDRYIQNPLTTKENLAAQKMNLEINLDLDRSSIKSLQNEYNKLNARFNSLVPHEAVIQAYEGNINVASQEYLEVLKKYNQTNMAFTSSSSLKQIEMAMPGAPQPSKKTLLVGVSGLGSFVFCLLILFVVFYIDDSINIPQELANKTEMPVMGYLPLLRNLSMLNLNQLWRPDNDSEDNKAFKSQLRSIRFETDNELGGSHLLAVTSLGQGEGKTFLAMSLASACLMINKRVLLIDGNFANPALTEFTQPEYFLEDYLTGKSAMPRTGYENDITVMGNRGTDTSLFEIAIEQDIRQKMDALCTVFDIIIIESSSLDTLNLSKEWLSVANKVIAVYESGKTISTTDKSQIEYLRELKDKYVGWVINRVPGEYMTSQHKKSRKKAMR